MKRLFVGLIVVGGLLGRAMPGGPRRCVSVDQRRPHRRPMAQSRRAEAAEYVVRLPSGGKITLEPPR